MDKLSYDGPIVLAILDGVGLAPDGPGNAVSRARTSFLGKAAREYLHVALDASGEAVGLVAGQMGNSEVGHNTMGAGRAIKQGIAKIEEAFATGEVFDSEAWKGAILRVLDRSEGTGGNEQAAQRTLHFAGIFSDGGVHSHISHLEQMIQKAYDDGVRRMRVHAIFDGRDVLPQSEPKYIQRFEKFAAKFQDADIRIASGGGRMTTVSDRYGNDWQMVARGWDMMVNGEADYYFKSAEEAISVLRRVKPGVQDQNLPAFVIVGADEQPVGKIEKGDALIYFDFRADRAIEIAMAFTYWDFPYFKRGDYQPTDVYFVGMTEYNSDTHVPEHRLVEPVEIDETLNRFLSKQGISELAVSETVKFGHVTYYFNGNSYDKVVGEEHVKIDSYTEPYETRPWMRTAEITDVVLENLDKYKFVRLNYPGGDMVGHTADMEATIVAMEAIDLSLARIAAKVDELGGVLVIVADHGNAEELLDANGAKKTSHTTNKVPCIIYDNTANRTKYQLAPVVEPGLANIAATMAVLLGENDYPESWDTALIEVE
ncbi:2,3-bisphosphoglycerate-independent phosphoglycerate mutase [Candidatus Nanosyncoccus alces]|uniref:2,3-bisphosphoglycerate-independent phosphoglycerate mutase n=1 Tax=Candidatus Nanosyncoccus alces TaxID=2171997 RepID=A0ABY0FMR7_9BACT|nr:2,3-bisphosphoglycerate-independent phosphoglycerate mutase [Candidatus Nanosyncoccus alces]RYC75120.1 2,3-bisphosphoglycerate-independent phosphoglycerate mutase [Candidatus Nanosyncoccus alces]